MLQYEFFVLFCAAVHDLQTGLDELSPQRCAHDHSALLSPVVTEIYTVKGVLVKNVDDLQVVLQDLIQQGVCLSWRSEATPLVSRQAHALQSHPLHNVIELLFL